jgi:dipeptidyl aminopeptidase/acylaminoacyl peptidase
MGSTEWLGKDEHNGVPSQARPDAKPPPHWRLATVYATGRPHSPSVSPDGSMVAFVLSVEGTNDIYVMPVGGGQARALTSDRASVAYWEDSSPCWSPDGTRLAYGSGGDTFVVAVTGGPALRVGEMTPGAWLDNDRLVVVVERDRTTRLATVSVSDAWPQPFGPTGGNVGGVRATGDGRVLAVFWPRDDFSRSDIVVADPEGGWRTIVGQEGTRALGAEIHGETVAYVMESPEWRAVYLTDLEGADHRLLVGEDADFGELAWSPDGERIAAVRARHGQWDLVTLDLEGKVELVEEGGAWQGPGWSGDDIVAVHESHATVSRLVRMGPANATLHDGAPVAITAAPHRGFERVTYASTDGTEIEGFLFRPVDTETPVAAVVYPHGGPTSVYGDEWDGYAQYFVDKGYAWLAINFRGSTTYGRTFERANHDDWGVGDTEDCIAAARFLQSLGWVDPDRIAIFGASYGSYMALTSLVHPENPFACGVLKYGDCDILTSWAQGDREGRDDLERMMGHPSTNRAAYLAGSPIHVIANLERPVLIAHGEQDARVHPKQAEQLVADLRRLDKRFEYVTYPQEGHGLLRRESAIHFHERLERFLDWHLM